MIFYLLIYPSTHILIRLALHLIRDQQLAKIMLWDPGILLVPYHTTGTIPTSACHNTSQPTNLLSKLPPRIQSSCQREETQEKQEGREGDRRGRRKEGNKEQRTPWDNDDLEPGDSMICGEYIIEGGFSNYFSMSYLQIQ